MFVLLMRNNPQHRSLVSSVTFIPFNELFREIILLLLSLPTMTMKLLRKYRAKICGYDEHPIAGRDNDQLITYYLRVRYLLKNNF